MSDSFVILRTEAHQVPLFTGFPRQKYWSGLPFASLGGLHDPRIEFRFLPLAGGFFKAEPPGKPGGITLSNLSLLNRTQRVIGGPPVLFWRMETIISELLASQKFPCKWVVDGVLRSLIFSFLYFLFWDG